MTDAVLVAAIGAIPGTIASILGYINRRSLKENKAEVKAEIAAVGGEVIATKQEIQEFGKQIDGRMSENIALTKEISFAAGAKQQKADVKARKARHKLIHDGPA